MEEKDSTERDEQIPTPELDHTVLMSSKPLYRFVQNEPRSLGIVILLLGCGELMMGFSFFGGNLDRPNRLYVPFWLGSEFILCGALSIFTGANPSKKMVTVCLAVYIISILGIIVSAFYRIEIIAGNSHMGFLDGPYEDEYWTWTLKHARQLSCLESVLFLFSLCVLVLLIFLSNVARLALKSTHTQVIFRQVQAPPTQPST